MTRDLAGVGPLAGASGTVTGYEIHMGETRALGPVERPLGPSSTAAGRVLGTYLHGLFENPAPREAFVDAVFRAASRSRPEAAGESRSPFDRAAALVGEHLDLDALGIG